MSKEGKIKVRHSSLEMPDAEVVKKKYDMLAKARNKLFNFGDSKTPKNGNATAATPDSPTKKTRPHSTIECLFRATQRPFDNVIGNDNIISATSPQSSKFQKQNSVGGGYPIKIQVEDYEEDRATVLSRDRPATICVDKIDRNLGTDALALERPRKKLSFKEPESVTCAALTPCRSLKVRKDDNTLTLPSGMKRSISFTNGIIRSQSEDSNQLESQAMKVVRTVGQAFEVCHKISVNSPEHENLDQEEQETLTQDLMSDRLSDVTSDKGRKDLHSDFDLERMSLPGCDDFNLKDLPESKTCRQNVTRQVDLLPPPPTSCNESSLYSQISAETYSSPNSDLLATENNAIVNSLPPAGAALSAHHEIQLLKEQLDQQSQQTQAAMAQLQLAREQLASEQAARIEAQTRTHQLLVHNRELLDHITALVSHLQGGSENSGGGGSHHQQQSSGVHTTLPQHQKSGIPDPYVPGFSDSTSPSIGLDNNLQQLGLNANQGFIENRAVTACLPNSPLGAFNHPSGNIFNFPYGQETTTYETQLLLQRLQALSGYPPPNTYPVNPYSNNFNSVLPYFRHNQSPYYPSNVNNNQNYTTLPHPRKISFEPMMASSRHSFNEGQHHQQQGNRHNSEPRQIPYQYTSNSNLQFNQLPNYPLNNINNSNRQVQQTSNNSPTSPTHNTRNSPLRNAANTNAQRSVSGLIKPLSQPAVVVPGGASSMRNASTDFDAKTMRVNVVPSSSNSINKNNNKDTEGLFANLKLIDDFGMNGPPIQRTTSEKVPNRSELMQQVQRAMWARHTTK